MVSILENDSPNDAAMKEILTEAGFPISFPDEVMEEAGRLPDIIGEEEVARRKDCRNVLTFTIDPVDAKDFDDAISFKRIDQHTFEIGVHIADVSHYVQPNTALDQEALNRGTSVYLVGKVIPMLPEKLSNELCSLRPNEDKLTFSAVFKMDLKGTVLEQWFGRTIIHSIRRFTYEEVWEILQSGQGDYAEELTILNV